MNSQEPASASNLENPQVTNICKITWSNEASIEIFYYSSGLDTREPNANVHSTMNVTALEKFPASDKRREGGFEEKKNWKIQQPSAKPNLLATHCQLEMQLLSSHLKALVHFIINSPIAVKKTFVLLQNKTK